MKGLSAPIKNGEVFMISFIISVVALIAGYLIYGKIVEKNFEPDGRQTPAVRINDGVDYVPMPTWKVFLIQLLNIAGTGPIFGALSGALFGPIVYLWIVLGCIFAGSVHDFYCGMISARHDGQSISELSGQYLGNVMRQIMRVFSVILLVMCGVVFTTGPAGLLDILTKGKIGLTVWIIIITVYYFFATFVPIDKVIGKLYPVFGVCLIIMAVGVAASMLFSGKFVMPEVWNNFGNLHCDRLPVWPFMFITVACGAISGFHATQSPMMARCINSEKNGRKVFYGAMITEGIIALVWAAAGVTCYESSRALMDAGAGCSEVVYTICQSTMGRIGGILAMIGVVVCPISSGDTAYRSARLTLADWFKLDQAKMKNRLILTIPLLAAGCVICGLDYNVVWRYFSWSNQTLAMIALWTFSVYLKMHGKNWQITAIPAAFMSAISVTYFLDAPECLGFLWDEIGISSAVYNPVSIGVGIICAICLYVIMLRNKVDSKTSCSLSQ